MGWDRSKILTKWFTDLTVNYNEFRKESKRCRCKIVNVETNQKTNVVTLFVMINGIKKQVIPYSPKELVVDDAMLEEFSSFDVRAITFYAMQQNNKKIDGQPECRIDGQEFLNGKTVFIVNKIQENGEERWSAHELYCDAALLTKFGHDDLKNIISTAIQEQAIEDFHDEEE